MKKFIKIRANQFILKRCSFYNPSLKVHFQSYYCGTCSKYYHLKRDLEKSMMESSGTGGFDSFFKLKPHQQLLGISFMILFVTALFCIYGELEVEKKISYLCLALLLFAPSIKFYLKKEEQNKIDPTFIEVSKESFFSELVEDTSFSIREVVEFFLIIIPMFILIGLITNFYVSVILVLLYLGLGLEKYLRARKIKSIISKFDNFS